MVACRHSQRDTFAVPNPSARLADRDTRPAGKHARGNTHRHELLEKQLGCVRHVYLRNLGLVLARPAFEGLLGEVPGKIIVSILLMKNRKGGPTRWASSTRKSRKCARGTHQTPQTDAPSRTMRRRGQSYNHVPFLRNGDRRLWHDPQLVDGS